jgi:hypothetical protein
MPFNAKAIGPALPPASHPVMKRNIKRGNDKQTCDIALPCMAKIYTLLRTGARPCTQVFSK